ncbi:MAG: phosphoglycolate phosphatase [Alphaproteobacteria bacterium]|nr:phosphoglycolate phosphatase [Alphaproteobacteria bacterium]
MNGDFCNTDGARKLKAKIEEYWSERGFDVNINLVEAGFVPAMRSARTDVRSNMVNGMPPRKKSDRKAEIGRPSSYMRGIG